MSAYYGYGGFFMDQEEEILLRELLQREDLAKKKANIYARLLMDVEKAKKMEELALRHQAQAEKLEIALFGKVKKTRGEGK